MGIFPRRQSRPVSHSIRLIALVSVQEPRYPTWVWFGPHRQRGLGCWGGRPENHVNMQGRCGGCSVGRWVADVRSHANACAIDMVDFRAPSMQHRQLPTQASKDHHHYHSNYCPPFCLPVKTTCMARLEAQNRQTTLGWAARPLSQTDHRRVGDQHQLKSPSWPTMPCPKCKIDQSASSRSHVSHCLLARVHDAEPFCAERTRRHRPTVGFHPWGSPISLPRIVH
ncbi:hypothetical protein B0I35DRAFT_163229 [Stachybotrys elegans]|uniref:Uncharacterized protein n=1 Tax=Stachybotrys elegans TaxID=80388 RepID=A0A8K0WVI7_9HYPO|nr:hypothetical protein B0I35DRAFT_163229 [Stachybotrys elegans]